MQYYLLHKSGIADIKRNCAVFLMYDFKDQFFH